MGESANRRQGEQPQQGHMPRLDKLGREILLLILEAVHKSSPATISSIALASSSFHRLARYVQHRDVTIRVANSSVALAERVELMNSYGLLPAVRRLRVQGIRAGSSGVPLLCESLSRMSGLRDLEWLDNGVPSEVLASLLPSTSVRLHASARNDGEYDMPSRGSELEELVRLQDCPNLHALRISCIYTGAENCLKVTRPLRRVLLSCPNLRILELDISLPRSGCVIYGPPEDYCGLGLTGGERPPALEELRLDCYPWGYTPTDPTHGYPFGGKGYPGSGSELEYWAGQLDWTRLRRLSTQDMSLATHLAPRLPALKEVSFGPHGDSKQIVSFLRRVPPTLERITVPELPDAGLDSLARHGATLQSLQLHRLETGDARWREASQDAKRLCRIRDFCPHLEELGVDIWRHGAWPYETLDALCRFPKLRTLRIWFELGGRHGRDAGGPMKPYVTFSAADELFRYLREHRAEGLPRFQHLEIASGSPSPIGHGLMGVEAFWPAENSTVYTSSPSDKRSETGEDVYLTRCPHLSNDVNVVLQQNGDVSQFVYTRAVWVALHGPVPCADLDLGGCFPLPDSDDDL